MTILRILLVLMAAIVLVSFEIGRRWKWLMEQW